MTLDELPLWGMVGEMLPTAAANSEAFLFRASPKMRDMIPFVYTKRHLRINYNDDRIVRVDLTSDPKSLQRVKEGISLTFTLNIEFVETKEYDFNSRFDRYLDYEFFESPLSIVHLDQVSVRYYVSCLVINEKYQERFC